MNDKLGPEYRNTSSLFPVAVQTSLLPDAEHINREMQNEIDRVRRSVPNSIPDTWSCELYTTIGSGYNLVSSPGLKVLRNHILVEASAFAQTNGFDIDEQPIRLAECWLNVYGKGHSQEAHVHGNSVISGIYYVSAPKGSGTVVFHSPMADQMIKPKLKESNQYNNSVIGLAPKPGLMVLFRSWLRHSVKPTISDGERISIAFNLKM